MSERVNTGERIKVLEDVILGRPGKPEESLVVQVKSLTKSVHALGRFIWAMGILGASYLAKEILDLIINHGGGC